ncbi:MAG TPA: hypothetical protein VE377_17740 [Candidatus Dormibacteraeota bacterium]|nr:hypothetical protein [Candidatus Dormibacteraeota bacterium]
MPRAIAHHPRLFVPSKRIEQNTVLNWHNSPEKEFRFYGEAFWNAARKLVEGNDLDSGGLADFSACPIVYLYRHAVELFLKGLVIEEQLLGSRTDIKTTVDRGHSLKKQLPGVRRIFETYGWQNDFGEQVSTFDDFEEIVNELEDVDTGSFSFRYPLNRELLGSLNSHFTFSAREFARLMDDVLNTLNGACFCLPEEIEARAKAACEALEDAAEYNP